MVHENNIIHCDVKPQNFLLFKQDVIKEEEPQEDEDSNCSFTSYEDVSESTSQLKLTDFGLSHIINDGEKVAFAKYSCGTHNYKAPELTSVSLIIN